MAILHQYDGDDSRDDDHDQHHTPSVVRRQTDELHSSEDHNRYANGQGGDCENVQRRYGVVLPGVSFHVGNAVVIHQKIGLVDKDWVTYYIRDDINRRKS